MDDSNFRGRLGLLVLIGLELIGATVVLWWASGLLQEGDRPPQDLPDSHAEGPPSQPVRVWMAEGVPLDVERAVGEWLHRQRGGWTRAERSTADLVVDWQKQATARALGEIILVPVAPFSTLDQEVSLRELRRAWSEPSDAGRMPSRLLVSPETLAPLAALWGPPDEGAALSVVPAQELTAQVWATPDAIAIVPFQQLEPRLKVLTLEGQSVLDRTMDPQRYPLRVPLWVDGAPELADSLAAWLEEKDLTSNRHPEHLTELMMTGVTALTRHLAVEMEARNDDGWPARHIAGFLAAADLTHISNEVSFVSHCQAQAETQVFCARPEYLETLRLVGADLVELTGNHNLDCGPGYALQSLELYAEAGMRTFGGGRNAADARQPLLITHQGNRLAFLGYNQFGPEYAWAGEDRPGAARFSLSAVQADVAAIRDQADVVFVTVQHTEAYQPTPLPEQVADFRAVIEAGADVVIGSQAHQPQAVEFYDGGLILYGLGNLFFDQLWSEPTRQSLIARHFLYEGRLISVQLVPTVMDHRYQVHLADTEEQRAILQTVFNASGW